MAQETLLPDASEAVDVVKYVMAERRPRQVILALQQIDFGRVSRELKEKVERIKKAGD